MAKGADVTRDDQIVVISNILEREGAEGLLKLAATASELLAVNDDQEERDVWADTAKRFRAAAVLV